MAAGPFIGYWEGITKYGWPACVPSLTISPQGSNPSSSRNSQKPIGISSGPLRSSIIQRRSDQGYPGWSRFQRKSIAQSAERDEFQPKLTLTEMALDTVLEPCNRQLYCMGLTAHRITCYSLRKVCWTIGRMDIIRSFSAYFRCRSRSGQ